MDRILIRDLRARCIIGINPEERRDKQDVLLNLALEADLRTPGRTDHFADTVDYRAIKKQVLTLVEKSHYQLLEALAQAVADLCLRHPQVQSAKVCVDKPQALRFARSVAVEITREKQSARKRSAASRQPKR